MTGVELRSSFHLLQKEAALAKARATLSRLGWSTGFETQPGFRESAPWDDLVRIGRPELKSLGPEDLTLTLSPVSECLLMLEIFGEWNPRLNTIHTRFTKHIAGRSFP